MRERLDEAEQKRLIDEALADVDLSAVRDRAGRAGGTLMAERIEAGARVYATALYEAAVDAGRSARSTATCARSATLVDDRTDLRRDAQPAAAA